MSNAPKVIKIEPAVVYITPIGFHQYASDFAAWAKRGHAEKSSHFSPVPYYLYCRSIELVLKAFLLTKGVTKDELKTRKLGHNLVALLTKAKEMSLEHTMVVESEWETELSKANDYYSKKDFEYFKVTLGFHGLPSLTILRELSEKLLHSFKQTCLDAADAPPRTAA